MLVPRAFPTRDTSVMQRGPCHRFVHIRRENRPMDAIIGLFPTPFMRAPGTLGGALVAGLAAHFTERATRDNNSSANLAHTAMLRPDDSPLLVDAAALISPKLVAFGEQMFG